MPMPTDIGVIDLMASIPLSDDSASMYEVYKPLLMDQESRDMFKMPAQYMFKDIPQVGPDSDKVGWMPADLSRTTSGHDLGAASQRVFQIDITQCDHCGGSVKIIGRSCASCAHDIGASMHSTSIEDPLTINRILEHLERPARGPPVRSPALQPH